MNATVQTFPARQHAGALRCVLLALPLVVVGAAAQAQASFDQTRNSSFAYYGASDGVLNGLLKSETIEPGNPQLCVTTTYSYDTYGNKTGASTASCAGATGNALFASRSSASTYEHQGVVVAGSFSITPAGTFAITSKVALTANVGDPASHTEVRTYDPRFGALLTLTSPNGLTTSWQLDDLGRKTRELRADGTSTVNYHCYITGRVSNWSTNATGCPVPAASEIPIDAIAFVHSEPRNTSDGKNGPFSRAYTDRAGRTIRNVTEAFDGQTQPGGMSRLIVQDADYSPYGPQTVATQPYFLDTGSSSATGNTAYGMTRTDYDVLGRPIASYSTDIATTGNLGGSQTGVAFGNRGSRQAAKNSISYAGLVTTTTNDKGQTRKEEKNVDGKLVRVTDAMLAQVAYQHDAFGNLLVTKDALQNQLVVSYDARGRKIAMTDPDTGYWQYDYNALGELVRQQSPNQRAAATATTMAYDRLGRMTTRTEPEYTSTWAFDKYANGSACNKGIGKLCESNTSTGVNRKQVYDGFGRPVNSRTTITNGPSFAIAVGYDGPSGRLLNKTYPTGLQVSYGYTPKGFLSTLKLATSATVTPLPAVAGGTAAAGTTLASGATLWEAQAYNARGQAEQQRYGNGVITKAAFDAATGRVTGTTAGIATATNVLNHGYVWDSLGRLVQRNDANGEDPNGDLSAGAVTDSFSYDSLGRLTSYTIAAPQIPNLARTVSMQYNALGMTLYKSDVGIYVYGAQNTPGVKPHALQSVIGTTTTSYTYDANGNVITAGSGKYRNIAYTSFNLPDSNTGMQGPGGAPKYTWAYDENHQRIKETQVTGAGTRTTWNLHPDNVGGLGFESESSSASPTPSNRHYLSAGGVSVGVLVSRGALPTLAATQTAPVVLTSITAVKVEYWHNDHLGSLIATTDHAGSVTARYAYDPFGKRRSTNGRYDPLGNVVYDWTTNTNHGTDRGYTGHEHLDDLGVIHMNGRIFDPTLGRFMQGDPLIQSPGNLQNFDRYGYCLNDPLTCTDPSGFNFLKSVKFIDPLGYAVRSAVAKNKYGYMIGSIAIGVVSVVYCGAGGTAAVAACNGAGQGLWAGFAGKSFEDSVKTGLIAGATSYAYGQVGNWTTGVANVAGHAVVGCASAAASGGKCRDGAISGGLSSAYSNLTDGGYFGGEAVRGAMEHAAVGGVVSLASGGKFSDGALTGAFGYLFSPRFGASESQTPSGLGEIDLCLDCGSMSGLIPVIGAVSIGPGGEPYVPFDQLPTPSKYILQNRTVDFTTGMVNLELPPGYTMVRASSGGGILLVPPGWQANDNRNIVRIQPSGTGSSNAWGYTNGYYIVTNQAGAPISIYNGAQLGRTAPGVHNPLGPVLPPGFSKPRGM